MEKDRKKLVVIGTGIAGTYCLEEILRLDPGRYDITVFGKERHLSYNRVLLSYVLRGEKTEEDILLHDLKWYEKSGIRLHTACKVVEIDRGRRLCRGEGGEGAIEARYDKLILATGAVPIMPDIPGMDKKGVLYFREMGDCERIKNEFKEKGKKVVIIGGGILGLEAAHAISGLGAEVVVVHLADRLMEKHLDGVSAGFLKEDLEKMGIKVLLNKETVEITGGEGVTGVRFRDGESEEASLVVMSIGIRPNAELARASGIYCKKGVVVSDVMQSFDPAIYALGECVEHRGVTFGLVSPILEQAKVLANHLAGDGRLIFKNIPASVRLKIPGIELYSAGKTGEEEKGVEAIEYTDRSRRVYKKLFIKDSRVRGIILYGDTADGTRLFSGLLEGEDIAETRHSILFGRKVSDPLEDIPSSGIVCGCNGVTKGAIVEAITKKSLFTIEDVKKETKAGSSCGGCIPAIEGILERTLGGSFEGRKEAICDCTKYTRDDCIKNIREKRLKSVGAVMETLGWETVGCEKCRPALNYYVGMIWPGGAEDDATSRLVGERVHANIQKDGAFSVIPRIYGGVVKAEELRKIADVAIKYDVPLLKFTGGQRIGLFGVKREDLSAIWKELDMPSGHAYGKALRTVKSCVGDVFCRYGTQDSLGLAIEIEKRLSGLWTPAKVKIGVSGCPRNCAESEIKDIGIAGITGGWQIYVGGCAGIELKGGKLFTTVKTKGEAVDIVEAVLQYYREDGRYGERVFKWIGRVGLKTLKKAILDNIDNRNRLLSGLKQALSQVKDHWNNGGNDVGKERAAV